MNIKTILKFIKGEVMEEYDTFYYKGEKYILSKQTLLYRVSESFDKSPYKSYLKTTFIFSLKDKPKIFVNMVVNLNQPIYSKILDTSKNPYGYITKDKPYNELDESTVICPFLLLSFLKDYSHSNIFSCTKDLIHKSRVCELYEDTLNDCMKYNFAYQVDKQLKFRMKSKIEEFIMTYENLFSLCGGE